MIRRRKAPGPRLPCEIYKHPGWYKKTYHKKALNAAFACLLVLIFSFQQQNFRLHNRVSSPMLLLQQEELLLESFLLAEEILDQQTSSRGRSMFYEWNDEDGINITSIISFLEYSTTQMATKRSLSNLPTLPFAIQKIPSADSTSSTSSAFRVKFSNPILTTSTAYQHFKADRLMPQFKFLADALNSKERRGNKRWARLYDLLEKNVSIPILLDFSDTWKCYSEHKFTFKGNATGHIETSFDLPVFTMAIKKSCLKGFPIPTYLGIRNSKDNSSAWDDYMKTANDTYPWSSKKSAAVWRGSATGKKGWNERKWLHYFSISHNSTIDAKIANKNIETFMDFEDFQNYKAIIDLDGFSWSGRFHRLLCMNSVVIKIEPKFLDYNMNMFTPWVHYIPAFANSSLIDTVEYVVAPENDAKMKEIIGNAQEWCQAKLVREELMNDWMDIISGYVDELDKQGGWVIEWISKSEPLLKALKIE